MIRRIGTLALGLFLVGAVVQLGILSTKNPYFVVWFGVASAFAAPIAIAALKYTFTRNEREALADLLKVSEIDQLISKAKTQEEKLKILEEERRSLVEVIKSETRKRAIIERRNFLENEIVRIMDELKLIDGELADICIKNQGANTISEEVRKLYERLEAKNKKDITISLGNKNILFDTYSPIKSISTAYVLSDLLADIIVGVIGVINKKKK
ncbi:MAG: hypothetical protein AAGU75_00315 [Bacillota bacterium]